MVINGTFIPFYFDVIFTEIFNNPNNMDILENLLENYFDLPLYTFHNNILLKHRNLSIASKDESRKQVDILVEIENKSINIELNNNSKKKYFKRNRVYASKIHSTKLKKGDTDYENIGDTIQINLNTKFHNKKKVIEKWYITNEETNEKVYDLEIDMVDLTKGKLYNKSRFDKWCSLLLAENMDEFYKSLELVDMKQSLKEKLAKEFKELQEDQECIALYSDYTQTELEHNTELHESIEEERNNVAIKMLKKGYPISEINDITSLSVEEIEKLQETILIEK